MTNAFGSWSSIATRFGLQGSPPNLRGLVNGSDVWVSERRLPNLAARMVSTSDGGLDYPDMAVTIVGVDLYPQLDLKLAVLRHHLARLAWGMPRLPQHDDRPSFLGQWVATGDRAFDTTFKVHCEEAVRGSMLFGAEVRNLLQSIDLGVTITVDDQRVELIFPAQNIPEDLLTRTIAQAVLLAQALVRGSANVQAPYGLDRYVTSFVNLANRYDLRVSRPFALHGTPDGAKALIHTTNLEPGLRARIWVGWAAPFEEHFRLASRVGSTLDRFVDTFLDFDRLHFGDESFRRAFVFHRSTPILARALQPAICKSLVSLSEEHPIELTHEGISLRRPYCEVHEAPMLFERMLAIVVAVRDELRPPQKTMGPYR